VNYLIGRYADPRRVRCGAAAGSGARARADRPFTASGRWGGEDDSFTRHLLHKRIRISVETVVTDRQMVVLVHACRAPLERVGSPGREFVIRSKWPDACQEVLVDRHGAQVPESCQWFQAGDPVAGCFQV